MLKRSNTSLSLVWFLALTLLGVQVIQDSPLHHHTQHVVDCGLCHFDTHDQMLPGHVQPDYPEPASAFYRFSTLSFYPSLHYSPYQGRSPPTSLV